MRLSTAVPIALTVLLMTCLVGAVAATPSATGPAPETGSPVADRFPTESPPSATTQASVTPPPSASTALFAIQDSDESPVSADPNQEIRVALDENGDAHWTIESRFVIEEGEEDEFIEWAEAVAAGERDVAFDRHLFERQADDAADRTGREMAIEDADWAEPRVETVERESDAEPTESGSTETVRVGIVQFSFTWTDFATVENDRIYVGDAFQTESGVWLSLTENQRFVIEYPETYALDTPTQLEWSGPYQFSDGELDIVFVRSASGLGLGLVGWLVGAGLVLAVVAGAGYFLTRRNSEIDLPPPIDSLSRRLAELGITTRLTRIRSQGLESNDHRHDASEATPGTDGGTVQSTGEGPFEGDSAAGGTELEYEEDVDDGIDPELLSDEERVLRLLKQNGGRMKQGSIVSETGWSNAKVSQLLSKMDDDDDIEKLRIGRENLITLPEVDPTELD